jgi:predicted enzyme related to lactoylglutathione lyase
MAENSSSVYGEGVPCWLDAQLSDVEAGKRFYGELFGWTFERRTGFAAWALKDGEPVAALAPKTDGRLPTTWTVYFATPDAEALAGRVRAAGGQVVSAPLPVDGLGVTALVADPQGAVFALWQPGGHPGFGRRHEPGTFARAELYTRDTGAADDFYGGLFGEAPSGARAGADFGRAPVSDVFPPEMPPHFLVHFAVRDVPAALEETTRLGGRVQVPPFGTDHGTVAVVADDQGASFALVRR